MPVKIHAVAGGKLVEKAQLTLGSPLDKLSGSTVGRALGGLLGPRPPHIVPGPQPGGG